MSTSATLYETFILTVYEGFQRAVMELGLEPYDGDQLFEAAKAEAGEHVMFSTGHRLEVLLANANCLSERVLEDRTLRHYQNSKVWLANSGLCDGLVSLLKDYLFEEADFQFESWAREHPRELTIQLQDYARRRQKEVLRPIPEGPPVLALSA